MSKTSKPRTDVAPDSLPEAAAEMERRLNPMSGLQSGALKAAQEMDRRLNPLSGIESAAIRASRDMERIVNPLAGSAALAALGRGALHRSMADHVAAVMGSAALKSQLAAAHMLKPAFDAMTAMKPVIDTTGSVSAAFGAASQIRDLQRAVTAQMAPSSLDELRRGVTGLIGETHALASLDTFARVRDQLGGTLGLGPATQWDRFAATTALSSMAALSLPYDRPTAVMALARSKELFGTIAWLEPAPDEEAEDSPRVVVAALHAQKPADSSPWRELKIATGAAITCSNCGEPFELNVQLWLTGEDMEVFFQGEMLPTCGACGGDGSLLPELPMIVPYRLINGGGEGDRTAIGRLTLVVDNTSDDGLDE